MHLYIYCIVVLSSYTVITVPSPYLCIDAPADPAPIFDPLKNVKMNTSHHNSTYLCPPQFLLAFHLQASVVSYKSTPTSRSHFYNYQSPSSTLL